MRYLFISDLHLAEDTPVLTQAFLKLLKQEQGSVSALYILGDWFESWIGDDDDAAWLQEIVVALTAFHDAGGDIFFVPGNRDFLLGQPFLDTFHGQLLPDVFCLEAGGKRIRIEHGDVLCTDDTKYQAFRAMSRDATWQKNMLSQPLDFRRQIAAMMRMQSKANFANSADKIIDVNQEAVEAALTDVDVLLHGHTHRPQVHALGQKQRIVLGDWREQEKEAVIAIADSQGVRLESYHF